jgi:DNA-binding Lrp family transcriptional regulator
MDQNMFQIVYASDNENTNEIHLYFREEAKAMEDAGILVGIKPLVGANKLMYRGTTISQIENYPKDIRFINKAINSINCLYLSKYYPYIEELTIETFFSDDLDESVIAEINNRGWKKCFIKKDTKALEHIDEGKSVWPHTSFEEMLKLYNEYSFEGKYCIRKYVDSQKIIKEEERYWVFNGNIYHRHNKIPKVVQEAVKMLNKLGSKYYTIDATPEFIVEVNPGESSDRHGVNSAEVFASWIKKEFVSKISY